MTVAVHEAGDDRRTARVDHLTPRREIALLAGWPDPADQAVLRQEADTYSQLRGTPVGQRGVTVQGAAHDLTLASASGIVAVLP